MAKNGAIGTWQRENIFQAYSRQPLVLVRRRRPRPGPTTPAIFAKRLARSVYPVWLDEPIFFAFMAYILNQTIDAASLTNSRVCLLRDAASNGQVLDLPQRTSARRGLFFPVVKTINTRCIWLIAGLSLLAAGCKPSTSEPRQIRPASQATPVPNHSLSHLTFSDLPVPPKPKVSPEFIAQGKAVYAQNCLACHGQNGDGRATPPRSCCRDPAISSRPITGCARRRPTTFRPMSICSGPSRWACRARPCRRGE